jgi:1,4-dihydroxy-2-naphthoate octaprenyltransferase
MRRKQLTNCTLQSERQRWFIKTVRSTTSTPATAPQMVGINLAKVQAKADCGVSLSGRAPAAAQGSV